MKMTKPGFKRMKEPRTRQTITENLNNIFVSRVISSCSFTKFDSLVYFLSSILVHENSPQTIEIIEATTTTHVQHISQDTPQKLFDNLKRRAQTCRHSGDLHFQHVCRMLIKV